MYQRCTTLSPRCEPPLTSSRACANARRGTVVAARMRMRSVRSFVVAALATASVAACHGSEPGVPDSGGSGGDKGVIVPWQTTPATFPGNVTDDGDITVSSVSMAIDSFEAIGDAG